MALKELEVATQTLREVILVLRQNGADGWATDLEKRLQAMSGWYATKEHLYAIGGLCHPKALGDVYIASMSSEQWSHLVRQLHDRAARAFNILERLPEPQRESAVSGFGTGSD